MAARGGLASFLATLEAEGDPDRAVNEKRYHRSGRLHWGVSTPKIDRLVRDVAKQLGEAELLTLACALWRTGTFDAMVAATRIFSHRKVRPSPTLWRNVRRCMEDVDGWALEDGLARTAWKCIATDPAILDELETWTDCENFWWRRAVLIFTLPYAKPGADPTRMLGWMAKYADDREWFIQKAIGWWLRDLGRHDPDCVVAFLASHWPSLRAVARKEATRRLAPEVRARLERRLT
jgi:3-methyladenine DNA glycosylase AlkD